jgi:hypothetical protein
MVDIAGQNRSAGAVAPQPSRSGAAQFARTRRDGVRRRGKNTGSLQTIGLHLQACAQGVSSLMGLGPQLTKPHGLRSLILVLVILYVRLFKISKQRPPSLMGLGPQSTMQACSCTRNFFGP